MKKVLLFSIVVTLSFGGLYAKTCKALKQTRPVAKPKGAKTAHAKTVSSSLPYKTEFADFYIKNDKADTTAERRLFMKTVFDGMKAGSVMAYTNRIKYYPTEGNIFAKPLAYATLMKQLKDTAIVMVLDKDGNHIRDKKIIEPFTVAKINGYRVKRAVYVNSVNGKPQTNIIAIAPGTLFILSNGDTLMGIHPVCWLKYDQCKKIMANKSLLPDSVTQQMLFAGGKIKE